MEFIQFIKTGDFSSIYADMKLIEKYLTSPSKWIYIDGQIFQDGKYNYKNHIDVTNSKSPFYNPFHIHGAAYIMYDNLSREQQIEIIQHFKKFPHFKLSHVSRMIIYLLCERIKHPFPLLGTSPLVEKSHYATSDSTITPLFELDKKCRVQFKESFYDKHIYPLLLDIHKGKIKNGQIAGILETWNDESNSTIFTNICNNIYGLPSVFSELKRKYSYDKLKQIIEMDYKNLKAAYDIYYITKSSDNYKETQKQLSKYCEQDVIDSFLELDIFQQNRLMEYISDNMPTGLFQFIHVIMETYCNKLECEPASEEDRS